MTKYIELEELKKRIKDNIPNNGNTDYEGDIIEWCKDECIRQAYAMPSPDIVEGKVLKEMLENAMAIPKPMHLYIYFADEHAEKHMIKCFTDLSQTMSQFYYYEEPDHEPGKGKVFRRDEIKCFKVSFCPLQNWEQYFPKEKECEK